ncbi:hypothetical protein JW859_01340 [bacterium]|nr:hypothetical protein [bacterium]
MPVVALALIAAICCTSAANKTVPADNSSFLLPCIESANPSVHGKLISLDSLLKKKGNLSSFNRCNLLSHTIDIVFDLPLRYLEPGDILIRMDYVEATDNYRWNVGHAGLADPRNDRVIHSFPDWRGEAYPVGWRGGVLACSLDGPDPFGGAFQFSGSEELYLGAFRPAGWTPELGQAALEFAAGYLDQETAFILVGSGADWWESLDIPHFSCTGLVEFCYESVGLACTELTRWTVSPKEMYCQTWPVNQVAINRQDGEPLFAMQVSFIDWQDVAPFLSTYLKRNELLSVELYSGQAHPAASADQVTGGSACFYLGRDGNFLFDPSTMSAGEECTFQFSATSTDFWQDETTYTRKFTVALE